ncbi:hypothetical protein F5Y09DRAFT_349645 [Xylaria sp. FL1042]|nr:hypothetical protein F5Y09DRAFT_349645 [Xylaria sp. FL1042]
MKNAVDCFQRLETGVLEAGDTDTCMMDLVLRRQIVEAKKAEKEPSNPVKDKRMLNELFVILVGSHNSTANTLSWCILFIDAYPAVKSKLRFVLRNAFPSSDPPSVEDIFGTDLLYPDGVCEESIRLSGTAKANFRQTLVDTEILH